MSNFVRVFEELSQLYESNELENKAEDEVEVAQINEDATEEAPAEEAEAEEIEVEEDEDESAETEEQQVLECAKCGALTIKAATDVKIEDESDLANVEDACQYCNETAGYKVLGSFVPYKDEEELEEGIFDKNKEPKTIRGFSDKDSSFATKIAKELKDKFGGEIKQVKLSSGALADIWVDTNKKAKAANKYIDKQYPNDAFSYDEYNRIVESIELAVEPEEYIDE